MYKLARAYIHNLGVVASFFDDLEFDFRDKNGTPSNFLINLTNGGGKTTLISLIYTALLPNQDNFIQALKKDSSKELKHYVNDKHGFILLEFERYEEGVFNQKEKLIIMQSLINIQNNLTRYFYSFIPVEFTYDDCKQLIKNGEKLEKINEYIINDKKNQNFITYNIGEHSKRLMNYGFDKDILKLCTKFNKEEGDISKFINFSNKEEFLSKIFFLLIDNEDKKDLLDNIKNYKKQEQSKPLLEQKLKFFENILQISDELCDLNEKKLKKENQKDEVLTKLFNEKDYLDKYIKNFRKNLENLKEKENKFLNEKKLLNSNNEKYMKKQEFYNYKKVELCIQKLELFIKNSKDNIKANEITIHNLKTLKQLNIYNENKQKYTQIEKLMNESNKGLEPIKNLLEESKNKLENKLNYEISILNEQIQNFKSEQTTIDKTLNDISLKKGENDKELGKLENEKKNLEKSIINYENKRKWLFENAVLLDNETIKECEYRLNDEYNKNKILKENKEEGLKKIREYIINNNKNINNTERDLQELENHQKQYEKQIQEAYKLEQELKRNELLKEIVDCNADFVINNNLENKLAEKINQTEKNFIEQNHKIKELDNKINIIQDTKTPLISENTKRALDLLKKGDSKGNKVLGAGYYIHYLNTTEKSKLKEKLHKNPSIYSGLYVNNKIDIVKAKEILKDYNFNDIVFINEINKSDELNADFYINDDEKYYDINNYEDILNALRNELNNAKQIQDNLIIRKTKMVDIKNLLRHYLDKFGDEKLEIIKNNLDDTNKKIILCKTKIQDIKIDIIQLENDVKKLENDIKNLNTLIQRFYIHIEKIKNLLNINHNELIQELSVCKNKLLETEENNKTLSKEQEQLKKSREEINEQIAIKESKINIYQGKYDYLNISMKYQSGLLSILSIDDLDREYKKRKQNYDDFLKEKNIDTFKSELEKTKEILSKNQKILNELKNSEKYNEKILNSFNNLTDLDLKIDNLIKDNKNFEMQIYKNEGQIDLKKDERQKLLNIRKYNLDDLFIDENIDENIDELIKQNNDFINENNEKIIQNKKDIEDLNNIIIEHSANYNDVLTKFKEYSSYLKHYEYYEYKKVEYDFIPTVDFNTHSDLLNNIEKDINNIQEQMKNEHQKYAHIINNFKFKNLLENYNNLQIDDLITLRQNIKDNINITKSNINILTPQYENAIFSLQNYTEKICNLLHNLALKSRLDEKLGQIGGKDFIKISNFDKNNINIKELFEFVISDEKILNTKDEYDYFSAKLIIYLNQNIKINIIKIDNINNSYIDICESTSSGGEGLTMAFVLFLILARLKYAKSDKNMRFLILDNPIGKANNLNLLQTQIQMANRLNFQLIYVTGITDKNAQISFLNRINIAKNEVDLTTGRHYLRQIRGMIDESKVD